jgi:RNA recognition motif-containing protein
LRNSLYVGNLDTTDVEELKHLIAQFGTVRYAAVAAVESADPRTHFGIAEMQTEDEADAAIKTLNGSGFRGRLLEVRWATPAEQTACGHPAMFGVMNIPDPSHRQGARGNSVPKTAALPFGSETGTTK